MNRLMAGLVLFALATAAPYAGLAATRHDAGGPNSISLAALVAAQSPSLSATQKHEMLELLYGALPSAPAGATVSVRAQSIVCHVGNVDLMARGCSLSFGSTTVSLTGGAANELIAAMAEAGVPPNGAAGTIYYNVTSLACTIDFDQIREAAGEGADCAYGSP